MVSGEEWLITAEDGRKVPILCNAGPIRDGSGNIIGGIIAWADLTKQKQLEQELSSALIRYEPARPDDGPLRQLLRELAAERRRFGYRRLSYLLA